MTAAPTPPKPPPTTATEVMARTLPDGFQRPDHHVLAAGVVQQRRLVRQVDPVRSGHGVHGGVGGCRTQRPRAVVDVGAVDAVALVEGVEAVALGEEVLERAWPRLELGAIRAVAQLEPRRAVAAAARPIGQLRTGAVDR